MAGKNDCPGRVGRDILVLRGWLDRRGKLGKNDKLGKEEEEERGEKVAVTSLPC